MKKKAMYVMLLILVAIVGSASAQALRNEVFVEGGTFFMGADNGENNEKPLHEVTVSSFWIMKTEVTQVSWVLVGTNRSYFTGETLPVERVQWFEAVEYANVLSEKDKLQPVYDLKNGNWICDFSKNGWRLPTEAEWEYAAMGGAKSKGYEYAGSNLADAVAWYKDNAIGSTHPVGTKRANELGLYDMTGNVQEWCWDWYGSNYYGKSPTKDPRGPSTGTERVARGGSWNYSASNIRVAYRNYYDPGSKVISCGFRLVRPQF